MLAGTEDIKGIKKSPKLWIGPSGAEQVRPAWSSMVAEYSVLHFLVDRQITLLIRRNNVGISNNKHQQVSGVAESLRFPC
jgi:hypothetical protein